VEGDGVFSLRAFGDRLYAGAFGYGREAESMLWSYPPWGRVSPGLSGVSESICALIEFGGALYANTESSGDVARSLDGASWERVIDGEDGTIGCGLEVFGGALYAVNYDNRDQRAGRILRSADGAAWETVYDSGDEALYLRHLVAHGGELFALATVETAEQGVILSSADGLSWSRADAPTRFFRGLSWGGALYLSSTDRTSNGPAGIWRAEGEGFNEVLAVEDAYVTELAAFDGALWAGTSDGWKEATGTSRLLMSRDGDAWEEVCAFPEAATWAVAPMGDALFAGTWEYGLGGQVYAVEVVVGGGGDSGAGEAVDCAAIPAADPDWELCESGPDWCAGVYADGAGCDAFCGAAGLACYARYGGEPGCQKEEDYPIDCGEVNDHQSDWCECAL